MQEGIIKCGHLQIDLTASIPALKIIHFKQGMTADISRKAIECSITNAVIGHVMVNSYRLHICYKARKLSIDNIETCSHTERVNYLVSHAFLNCEVSVFIITPRTKS